MTRPRGCGTDLDIKLPDSLSRKRSRGQPQTCRPQAENNLRHLAAYRRELGVEPFNSVLTQAVDDTDLAEAISPGRRRAG